MHPSREELEPVAGRCFSVNVQIEDKERGTPIPNNIEYRVKCRGEDSGERAAGRCDTEEEMPEKKPHEERAIPDTSNGEEMMPPSSETDSEFSSEPMRTNPSEVDSDEQEQELMFREPPPEKEETRTAKKGRVNLTTVGGEPKSGKDSARSKW
jgi:hypothetical protein